MIAWEDLEEYLLEYTNVFEEVGEYIGRSSNDVETRVLNLKGFKLEVDISYNREDLISDITVVVDEKQNDVKVFLEHLKSEHPQDFDSVMRELVNKE